MSAIIAAFRRYRRTSIVGLMVAITSLIWIGCQTPVTGRRRILNPLISEAREAEMGIAAYNEMMAEEKPSTNARYNAMVQRVGQRIAAVAGKPEYQWEFRCIRSPQKNAFALPGGKVAIYEGILPVCQNEAGLAVVMSHEIAHAVARHGGERMAHDTLQNIGGQVAGAVMKNADEKNRDMVLSAYGAGSKYLAILPYSRKHESEADHIGLLFMAKAGYDPAEAPLFWERFGKMTESGPAEFMSTHPSHERRSTDLHELLPEAQRLYESAPVRYGRGEPITP